jgi:uncharacterized membrane-anchored protein
MQPWVATSIPAALKVVRHHSRQTQEVTLLFWIIKIAATTLGETGGDAVSMSMKLGYLVGAAIFAALFLVTVTAQIKATRFNAWLYWTTIIATTNGRHDVGGFRRSLAGHRLCRWYLTVASPAYGVSGRLVLVARLGVRGYRAPKAEMFYWVTIMFSQTLGTALGDWTAASVGLEYIGAAIVFGGLLALIAGAYFWTRISRTALFWTAFILTRPLGAVVGDFLDKPVDAGGLALSRYGASAALLVFITACILIFPQRPAKATGH